MHIKAQMLFCVQEETKQPGGKHQPRTGDHCPVTCPARNQTQAAAAISDGFTHALYTGQSRVGFEYQNEHKAKKKKKKKKKKSVFTVTRPTLSEKKTKKQKKNKTKQKKKRLNFFLTLQKKKKKKKKKNHKTKQKLVIAHQTYKKC